jgi:ankyrin repeat protein
MLQCLVKELSAYVNQADHNGTTSLHIAAGEGKMAVVQYLVKELGVEPTAPS